MAEINNIHFDYAATMMSRKSGITCTNEADFVLIKSNMAIAHEARTKNLIAYLALIVGTPEGEKIEAEILERLYG